MGHFCPRYSRQAYKGTQMKLYKFDDPDYEGYEIEIPSYIVKDIIIDYLRKTYYWPVALLSAMVGFLLGVLVK